MKTQRTGHACTSRLTKPTGSLTLRGSYLFMAVALLCVTTPSTALCQISTTGAAQISIGLGNTAPTGTSDDASACPNSNLVAFASTASNLTNSFGENSATTVPNIYLYSPTKGISLISKNVDGVAPSTGNVASGSRGPSISAVAPDGSFAVAYISDATDLVSNYSNTPGTEGTYGQAYVYLSATNQTLLLSKAHSQSGNVGSFGYSHNISVALSDTSPVTYRVCFSSEASNLVEGAVTEAGLENIYCKEISVDKGAATESALSPLKTSLSQGNLVDVSVSADGQMATFASTAEIIGGAGATGGWQIYSYSFSTQSFSLITKNTAGAPVQGSSRHPTTNNTGSVISFVYSPGETSPDLPGFETIQNPAFIQYTKASGAYSRLNASASGVPSDGAFWGGTIDSSGRYAVFSDSGSTLIDGAQGSTAFPQVYVKDLKLGTVVRVSVTSTLQSGDNSSGVRFDSSLNIPVTIGRNAYNSSELYASFISLSNNLATVGSPGSIDGTPAFLYRSPLSIPAPDLTRNFVLDTPPDVQIIARDSKGRLTLLLTFLKFKFNNSLFKSTTFFWAAKAERGKVTYEYDLKRSGSKFRIKKVVSRNTTTVRKLAPGTYTVRYRVIASKGKKTIRSRFSPKTEIALS